MESISGISTSGEFSETDNCQGVSLPAGASRTVNVTFAPLTAGQRSGTVSIFDNSPNAPQLGQLVGTAIDWGLNIPSGSSTTQTAIAGQTVTYQLNVTSGGFTGTVNLSCGNPPNANCSVAPSVNFTSASTAPVTVTVTTAPRSSAQLHFGGRPGFYVSSQTARLSWTLISAGIGIVGLVVLGHRTRTKIRLSAMLVLGSIMILGRAAAILLLHPRPPERRPGRTL
jgi:hypothetical protein